MVTRRDVSGAVGRLAARDRQRHEQQRRPEQLRQHHRRRTTNFARAILLSVILVLWWRVCAVLPQAVDRITAINSQPPHLYLFLRSLSAPSISLQAARRRFAEQSSE